VGVASACLAGALALMLGALTNPAAWDTAFWILLAAAVTLRPTILAPNLLPTPAPEIATP
jgi:hypothetical protein